MCVARALASASCALLGTPALAAPWQAEAGTLVFTEFEKVSGTELVLRGTTPLSPRTDLTLGAVVDVLVGASPNSATPSNTPQTFTTASGFDSYRTSARDEPLDYTFQDNRVELSAALDRRYERAVAAQYTTRLSSEFDYMALGFGTHVSVDSDTRDTRYLVGAGVSHERSHPVGGVPTPLASMRPPGTPQARDDVARTKNVFDLLVGVSQVLGHRTVGQLNVGHTHSDGYHNDPYKLVSIVDAGSGATVDYVYEQRPGSRSINSAFARLKHRLEQSVLDVSYRYTRDDWRIESHTVEFGYRRLQAGNEYWEPRLRWYRQSAAEFYRHSVTDAETVRGDLSADRRLAAFDAITVGVVYGEQRGEFEAFTVALEYYHQFGDSRPRDAVGLQRDLDLFPETSALLVRIDNSFVW